MLLMVVSLLVGNIFVGKLMVCFFMFMMMLSGFVIGVVGLFVMLVVLIG